MWCGGVQDAPKTTEPTRGCIWTSSGSWKRGARRDQAAFDLWRQEFNTERPHEALNMATPAERYQPSPRAYTRTPESLDYGTMETRKVHPRTGTIAYRGDYLLISKALSGWNVGLRPLCDERVEVWFAKLLLGHIHPKVAAFEPIRAHPRSPSRSAASSFWPSPLRCEGKRNHQCPTPPNTLYCNPHPTPCVTHVLNLMCYLCIDCAGFQLLGIWNSKLFPLSVSSAVHLPSLRVLRALRGEKYIR
ncbi:MAG: transposase [Bdellovibrionaceae bacterium]|nr:transposase [Pseudobdellovibrionaceae bacterium]